MSITITKELAQATVNYLSGRPYAEVFQLIAAFGQAAQVAPEKKEEQNVSADGEAKE